jgi:hypothetical protein
MKASYWANYVTLENPKGLVARFRITEILNYKDEINALIDKGSKPLNEVDRILLKKNGILTGEERKDGIFKT